MSSSAPWPVIPFRTLLVLICCGAQTATSLAAETGKAVGDTKFSQHRGFFESPFAVEITTKTRGAKIYFTTNGVEPTERTGSPYSEPLRITTTTVLRAAAFKAGHEPTGVDTQTYLFLKDVVKQNGAGFPPAWGTNQGRPASADYEMDPEIVNHPAYRDELASALKSIPTLSVVMAPEDLFDPQRGLYSNPRESGVDWGRPASAEFIYPDGRRGFHINCGVRIQGGWNRRPEESPKHSFRLVFKKKYGPGKLKFPLFGETGVREFDTITLRGGCNNTWVHWSGEERRRGDYIRDQWMRDTLRAMGHPSARGLFVHLYLNGLYWGLYNACERPNGPFVAAHLGGKPEDYDVRNGEHVLEGDDMAWKKLMSQANAGIKGEREFAAVQELLDVPQLIDFLIANFYGANTDWDHASNWYAARRREPPGKFQFFIWDGERTLESVDANSMAFDDDQSPPRLFQKLRENAEFRRMFAARARQHFTNGGALTPEKAAERYRQWTKEIDGAVAAESARWGDYRRDVHPYKTGPYELYTRNDHWRPEIERLFKEYFPKRTEVVIRQFREAGLYSKEN
ncbi:MAG TPA: CotH kinase family protein [Verrucomicrobiae bacterium]